MPPPLAKDTTWTTIDLQLLTDGSIIADTDYAARQSIKLLCAEESDQCLQKAESHGSRIRTNPQRSWQHVLKLLVAGGRGF